MVIPTQMRKVSHFQLPFAQSLSDTANPRGDDPVLICAPCLISHGITAIRAKRKAVNEGHGADDTAMMRICRKLWAQLDPQRRALLLQVIRYGVVGLGITLVQVAVYWVLATQLGLHSQSANLAGYIVAVALGYLLHGRVTFADTHGAPGGAVHATRGTKFVVASLLSYALNALWVWLCVSWMKWPEWAPIPAMLFVTPAIMFVVNKKWVFT